MKHDTFLILKLLIKFLKELVAGQGLFSAKSPCLRGSLRVYMNALCFEQKYICRDDLFTSVYCIIGFSE